MCLGNGNDVLHCLFHLGNVAIGRERKHIRAARLNLDDVAHGFVKQRLVGAEGYDEGTVLDEGNGSVLKLARCVCLGVDIGYLLEL